jgi:hypothetical protein
MQFTQQDERGVEQGPERDVELDLRLQKAEVARFATFATGRGRTGLTSPPARAILERA